MSAIVQEFEHSLVCPSLGLKWKLTFFSPLATAEFSKYWHIECSTFTASSFRIWNSSAGIPSPPLALFIVMLPKAHLTSHSKMSGSTWVITALWLSGPLSPFLYTTITKSLQSCPTLCDPIDGSPPGSPIPGILQARTLKWVAISFSNAWKWKVKVKSLSPVWLFATPWTAAYQAPRPMGFSRQEYWSGLPLPSPVSEPKLGKLDVH